MEPLLSLQQHYKMITNDDDWHTAVNRIYQIIDYCSFYNLSEKQLGKAVSMLNVNERIVELLQHAHNLKNLEQTIRQCFLACCSYYISVPYGNREFDKMLDKVAPAVCATFIHELSNVGKALHQSLVN